MAREGVRALNEFALSFQQKSPRFVCCASIPLVDVDDAVAVVRWLINAPSARGIFNVGTGQAASFRAMMQAMFAALGREAKIEYIDMPPEIRDSYQYFTQAAVENLWHAGFNAPFTPLTDAVAHYVTRFLDRADRYR